MHLSTLFSAVALPAAMASPWQVPAHPGKRASTTGATLYAYTSSTSGYPVLYDDSTGGLYVSASNTVPTGLQSVKWNIPGLSTSSTSTTTATLGNGTTIGALQLTVSDAEVVPVNVSSTGTTGVTVYGHQLVYLSGSSFESKFWAKEVDYAGETAYLVTWNEENTSGSGITPLTLKILGPATVAN